RDRRRDAQRLQLVHFAWQAGAHRAESAAPRAAVPKDHEARRPVRAPALVEVGASRLLADGVKLLGAHGLLYRDVALRSLEPDLEPLGLPQRSARFRTLSFHKLEIEHVINITEKIIDRESSKWTLPCLARSSRRVLVRSAPRRRPADDDQERIEDE